MKGVELRLERESEASLSEAHLTASFGRIRELRPLNDYLGRMRAARNAKQNPGALLAALKDFAARGGAKMTVIPRSKD